MSEGPSAADPLGQIADEFLQADITIHPMADQLGPALSIALASGRSAYDSMYLALAEALATVCAMGPRRCTRLDTPV